MVESYGNLGLRASGKRYCVPMAESLGSWELQLAPCPQLQRQQSVIKEGMQRGSHINLPSKSHHRPVPRIKLGGSPSHNVSLHRRGSSRWLDLRKSHGSFNNFIIQRNLPRATHIEDLAHALLQQLARPGQGASGSEGSMGHCAKSPERSHEQQLFP